MRNETGNHVEMRTGAYTYHGDAASFHGRRFPTRSRIAGKTGDQYIEAAAREVGLDTLREIIDGRSSGIDTLISHMRAMVFPLTEHESKELFHQYCHPGGPLSRQNGESVKQYVS